MVSNTSSTVLEKASSSDIAVNDKLSTKDDLQQYKMLSVQEEPLSSTQRHHVFPSPLSGRKLW